MAARRGTQYVFGTPPLNDANNNRTFHNPHDDPPFDDTKVNYLTGVQSTQFSTGTPGEASTWLSDSQNTTRRNETSRVSFDDEKPVMRRRACLCSTSIKHEEMYIESCFNFKIGACFV
jgi:hypothetical protein